MILEALARVPTDRHRRAPAGALAVSPYRDGSWRAQRMLHRSQSRWRVLVSGRGVGKTHGCAYELLQLVMDAPVGSQGAVLAPTLTHAEAAIDKLRQVAATLPGVTKESWLQSKRLLRMPGGRSIKVFSADRKETVRGPSIVALWIDEGAYVSETALTSSLPAVRTVGAKVRVLVSTTPAGKNWVFKWWEDAEKMGIERFRFKGTDSPYNDAGIVELARQSMTPEKFAQEYFAEFVDNLLLAFPERDGLFVPEFPRRKGKARTWLGVDVGASDYTVCTTMNEWGEAVVVGRWNEDTPGFKPATFFSQSHERVLELCRENDAAAVVDTGGRAGAPGAILAEYLRANGIDVVEIKTSNQGTKSQVVEQARVDVQWGRVRVLENEHSGALDYELSKFQAIKRVHHGRELMVYEGPQIAGEHDDCVISFCLANWGRARAGEEHDPLGGDFSGFKPTTRQTNRTKYGGFGRIG